MSKLILLADDSVTIQKVVALTIANQDYKLMAVGDGEAALSKMRETKPDIVIADSVMPKIDGYTLCKKIKTDLAFENIPVVLLAGTFEPYDDVKGKEVGIDDVIVKPFESNTFLTTLSRTLTKGSVAKPKGAISQPVAQPVAPAPVPQPFIPPKPPEQPVVAVEPFDFADVAGEEAVGATPQVTAVIPKPAQPPMAKSEINAFDNVSLDAFEQPKEVEIIEQQGETAPAEAELAEAALTAEEPIISAKIPAAIELEPATPTEVHLELETPAEVAMHYGEQAQFKKIGEPSIPLESAYEPIAHEAVKAVSQEISSKGGGQLPREEYERIAREEVEKVIWEIVPELAEAIIREEINKLLKLRAGI